MATVRIYNLTSENTSPQAGQYLAIDGSSTLQKINYSNLKKGIIGDSSMNTSATTVTGAIAEHSSDIASLETDVDALQTDVSALDTLTSDIFLLRTYSTTYSIGGDPVNLAAQDFNMVTPTGYTPVAFTRIATGHQSVVIRSYNVQATGGSNVLNLWSYNAVGNALTATVTVLYVKTSLIGE